MAINYMPKYKNQRKVLFLNETLQCTFLSHKNKSYSQDQKAFWKQLFSGPLHSLQNSGNTFTVGYIDIVKCDVSFIFQEIPAIVNRYQCKYSLKWNWQDDCQYVHDEVLYISSRLHQLSRAVMHGWTDGSFLGWHCVTLITYVNIAFMGWPHKTLLGLKYSSIKDRIYTWW